MKTPPKKILITGTAGFIGFHLAKHLLNNGHRVIGYDGITEYYDTSLKQRRHHMLKADENFTAVEGMLEDAAALRTVFEEYSPEVIVHLAAQAGVRYSIENPKSYVDSNLIGSFNILEMAKEFEIKHLLMASTSSVYGANTEMPFDELQRTKHQVSFYAATKKANEVMAHSYAHIYGIPTTMFRFFTVYGPWGRPDMALFRFARAMLSGESIDVYNHGKMRRDFTYIADLVKAITLLVDAVPPSPDENVPLIKGDSLSPVAPWRVVNIGNGDQVELMDFITALETSLGISAEKNMMEIQKGDVFATLASNDLLKALTGYAPSTRLQDGVDAFVAWYKSYYGS